MLDVCVVLISSQRERGNDGPDHATAKKGRCDQEPICRGHRSGTFAMGCGSPPRTFAAHGAQNNAEPNASSLRTETRPAQRRRKRTVASRHRRRRKVKSKGPVASRPRQDGYFFLDVLEPGFVWARSLPATLLTDLGVLGLRSSFDASGGVFGLVWHRLSPYRSTVGSTDVAIVASLRRGCKELARPTGALPSRAQYLEPVLP